MNNTGAVVIIKLVLGFAVGALAGTLLNLAVPNEKLDAAIDAFKKG